MIFRRDSDDLVVDTLRWRLDEDGERLLRPTGPPATGGEWSLALLRWR